MNTILKYSLRLLVVLSTCLGTAVTNKSKGGLRYSDIVKSQSIIHSYTFYKECLKKRYYSAIGNTDLSELELLFEEVALYQISTISLKEAKDHSLLVLGYVRLIDPLSYNKNITRLILQYAHTDLIKESEQCRTFKENLWKTTDEPSPEALSILKMASKENNLSFINECLYIYMKVEKKIGYPLDLSKLVEALGNNLKKISTYKDNLLNPTYLKWLKEKFPTVEPNPEEWSNNSLILSEYQKNKTQIPFLWGEKDIPYSSLLALALHRHLEKKDFPQYYHEKGVSVFLFNSQESDFEEEKSLLLRYYLRYILSRSREECKRLLFMTIANSLTYKDRTIVFENFNLSKKDPYFFLICIEIMLEEGYLIEAKKALDTYPQKNAILASLIKKRKKPLKKPLDTHPQKKTIWASLIKKCKKPLKKTKK